jgi:molybdenum cofactor cytidylyltransferase
MNYNISSIVLAAGMSKRMLIGNKLLLKVKNKTLLEKTLDNIISANFSKVSVVLGHDNIFIANLLKNYNVNLYYNPKYKEGISSSIVEGVNKNNINSDGIMICLADMPEISKSVYNKMLLAFQSNYKKNIPLIIMPIHNKIKGNPIVFSKHFFNDLKKLKGDIGAKRLILKNEKYIKRINITINSILNDIDTTIAYNNYIKNEL